MCYVNRKKLFALAVLVIRKNTRCSSFSPSSKGMSILLQYRNFDDYAAELIFLFRAVLARS